MFSGRRSGRSAVSVVKTVEHPIGDDGSSTRRLDLPGHRSSNPRSSGPPRIPWFELGRVRTLIYVCMHVHPWFEPLLSSNVWITWGASHHQPRVFGAAF